MSSFAKWQVVSLVSRFLAMGFGIIQGIFIVRWLSMADYGLVGLVTSIGNSLGMILHLGLVSGATREISASDDKGEASKIFFSALILRYGVAVPVATGLLLGSSWLANNFYHQPLIELPLKLFAIFMLIDASQGICNAALSGLHRFKHLFLLQVVIAFLSVCLYLPLVYRFGFYGYFAAMLILAVINSAMLWILGIRSFAGQLVYPSRREIAQVLKRILSIGVVIYIVKLIFTFWDRLGPLFLGKVVTAAELGVFNFALFYATKLMTASDAITDVNLPVLTKALHQGVEKFEDVFMKNYEKVYALIIFAATAAIFWSQELVQLVVGSKYDQALVLIPVLVVAFWLYSHVNILKASIFIPAKMRTEMIVAYALLFAGTVGGYLGSVDSLGPLMAMAVAMVVGGTVALGFTWVIIYHRMKFSVFGREAGLVSVVAGLLLLVWAFRAGFWVKAGVFLANGLVFWWLLQKLEILPRRALLKLRVTS